MSENPLGPDEWPKVTHGNTLVSDLSLVEVAKIINVRLLCCTIYLWWLEFLTGNQ